MTQTPSEKYIQHVIDEVRALDQMVDALIATLGRDLALDGETLDRVMVEEPDKANKQI